MSPSFPDVFVSYPILSLPPGDPSTDPQLTTFNFYPGFGAYNDELYEEYLEHTVISGVSKTGGIYSAFEVLYILLFGRSLLAAVFGSKPISPFGALASVVQRDSFRKGLWDKYPGIVGNDPKLKAEATCEFLHDYILNLKPLEAPPKPDEYSHQTKESDIESTEKTPPNLPYIRKNATGSSDKIV
ncbi:hypothetical protein FRC04_009531 [Tulasnella sp. 424]|nr:hypothetical protein FRC04_009531 [Tulasnella sp. 424]